MIYLLHHVTESSEGSVHISPCLHGDELDVIFLIHPNKKSCASHCATHHVHPASHVPLQQPIESETLASQKGNDPEIQTNLVSSLISQIDVEGNDSVEKLSSSLSKTGCN